MTVYGPGCYPQNILWTEVKLRSIYYFVGDRFGIFTIFDLVIYYNIGTLQLKVRKVKKFLTTESEISFINKIRSNVVIYYPRIFTINANMSRHGL